MKRFLAMILCLSALFCACNTAIREDLAQSSDTEAENTPNIPIDEGGKDDQTPPTFSSDPNDYIAPSANPSELTLTCVSYKTLGDTHFVTAFENEGAYYMVLPPSAPMEGVALHFGAPKGSAVSLDGEVVSNTVKILDFSKENTLTFDYRTQNKQELEVSLTVWQSEVPTVYLDVDESIQSVERMHADSHMNKVTHCYGTVFVDSSNNAEDLISHFDIHGHGNATWWRHDKKPYNLKLTDDAEYDSSRKVNLLGMRNSAKWVLLADVWDETMTKTALAHYMGEQVEVNYAIQYRYVNLYIKDDYRGLYIITEKPAEADRVLDLELATDDSLNGSWVLEFDNRDGVNQINVDGTVITIKSTVENCEYNALKQYIKEVQTALNTASGVNKQTGKTIADYIDIESYAKYLLVREFTMDNDEITNNWAYFNAADQKMYAGPLWDFDNSMGNNTGEIFNDYNSLLVFTDTKNPDGWFVLLMKHQAFIKAFKEQYEKYAYLFDVEDPRSVFSIYESMYDQMSRLMVASDLRWGYVSQTRELTGFEYDNSAYAREYSYLARFLYNRCLAYGKLIREL